MESHGSLCGPTTCSLAGQPHLLASFPSWAGEKLRCHCESNHECHADALMTAFEQHGIVDRPPPQPDMIAATRKPAVPEQAQREPDRAGPFNVQAKGGQ